MLASPPSQTHTLSYTVLYIYKHFANFVGVLLVNIASAVQNMPSTWSTPTPLLRLSTLRNLWSSCVLIEYSNSCIQYYIHRYNCKSLSRVTRVDIGTFKYNSRRRKR
jgi:hypothetical protein